MDYCGVYFDLQPKGCVSAALLSNGIFEVYDHWRGGHHIVFLLSNLCLFLICNKFDDNQVFFKVFLKFHFKFAMIMKIKFKKLPKKFIYE